MATTKRPQNKCKSCSYTWYPRGKSLSNKCPNCGSSEVSIAGTGGGLIAVAVIAYAIFANQDKPVKPLPSTPASFIEAQSTSDSTPKSSNVVPAPLEAPPLLLDPQTVAEPSKRELASTDVPKPEVTSKSNRVEVAEELRPTPSSICKNEGNYFSRNNCMWKQCEKLEFSKLEECSDKRPIEQGINGQTY